MMSIFHELGRQRRDINSLFCDLREVLTMKQRGVALALFQLAAKKLLACIRAEHAVVYPRFADIAELVEEVAKARRGHEAIESSITLLRIGGLQRDAWNAEVERLIGLLGQNFDLEELSLFPIAGLSLTTRQLEQIGVEFAAHLAHSATVAGASITYDTAPVARRAVAHSKPTLELIEVCDTEEVIDLDLDEVIDLDLDETAYVFDRP